VNHPLNSDLRPKRDEASPPTSPEGVPEMSKLKVAIIGVGGIAHTHVPGWQASEHAELVAGCDINETVLATWCADNGINQFATDPEQLFAEPAIDIIDICTPSIYHAPLTIAALRAGKHVLCEKPLAPTPEEIAEMIAVRDASGKMLMTAQHHRFSDESIRLKAEINAGALGHVYHGRGWMLRRAAAPVGPGFILKEHSGGGACIDIGVHILDLCLWFMGNPSPVSVTGVARTELANKPGAFSIWGGAIPSEMDVEEFAAAFVRFDNGASLILEVSWLLHHDTPAEDMQLWLYGKRGGAHWPKCEIYETNNERQQLYNRHLQLLGQGNPLGPHARECVAFAKAVAEGSPSPVPAEQSLDVMRILDGVYRSQTSGREIRLNDPGT
jgi:predicted dehydrogenase